MRFSDRTEWESGENRWAAAIRRAREAGRELVDLTVSNPTRCGLGLEEAEVLAPLRDPGSVHYSPDPLGMWLAREAVAEYCRDGGADVLPERICLTSSTSEAYSYLFRLLCDPGDEVLIARPSYPLFDLLARLDDVVLREYPLFYEPGAKAAGGRWSIDLEALEGMISERTRAVIAVHPNNPTGNYVSASERAALREICARCGLALIVDEVFLDFAVEEQEVLAQRSFAAEQSQCLCFVLSGLSKICALPQMKLSWVVVCGPEVLVKTAMERMEIVADTFLSVGAPAQFGAGAWLRARHGVQRRICERLRMNVAVLDERLRGSLADRLSTEGGWTAVLRVPREIDGEEFAVAAVDAGVLVQPGEFYGLPQGRCVVSLLTSPEAWRRGLGLLPV